jgi:hypothetical protein
MLGAIVGVMPPSDRAASTRRNSAVKLTLGPPETVPITKQQYDQAVGALSAMILSWLQRRQNADAPQANTTSDQQTTAPKEQELSWASLPSQRQGTLRTGHDRAAVRMLGPPVHHPSHHWRTFANQQLPDGSVTRCSIVSPPA